MYVEKPTDWPPILIPEAPRSFSTLLPPRQWACPGEVSDQLKNLRVPRHLFDHFVQFHRSQRRSLVGYQFVEVIRKLRISKNLAHRLFENLNFVFGCSWRQDVRRTHPSESAPNGENSLFSFGLSEAFYLRKVSEAGVFNPLRRLHNSVEIHQPFVHPIWVAAQNRHSRSRPNIHVLIY